MTRAVRGACGGSRRHAAEVLGARHAEVPCQTYGVAAQLRGSGALPVARAQQRTHVVQVAGGVAAGADQPSEAVRRQAQAQRVRGCHPLGEEAAQYALLRLGDVVMRTGTVDHPMHQERSHRAPPARSVADLDPACRPGAKPEDAAGMPRPSYPPCCRVRNAAAVLVLSGMRCRCASQYGRRCVTNCRRAGAGRRCHSCGAAPRESR